MVNSGSLIANLSTWLIGNLQGSTIGISLFLLVDIDRLALLSVFKFLRTAQSGQDIL